MSIAVTLAQAERHLNDAARLLVRGTMPAQERWILSQVDCELLLSDRPLKLAREAIELLGEHAEMYWV